MSTYADTTAVVIGGTHGMGLAIAQAVVAGGGRVLITGRDDARLATAREQLGAAAETVRADVTRPEDLTALAAAAEERLGRIDALFVNQGYAKLTPFDAVTEELYDRHFDVNTKGAFFAVQRLAPLVRDGGAIVFTSSVADEGGNAGMAVYAASKAAVWSFAQAFAAELLPRGIRVNVVSPGFVATPTSGVDATDAERAEFVRLGDEVTPMKRHGTAEEVAAAALFLAYQATFTTAVKLPVDGGLGRRLS